MDGFLTSRAVSDFLLGLDSGLIIGLVALSLVLIWRSTHVLNFAQGAMAMFATYCGLGLLSYQLGYWWCVAVAIVAGMALGGLTERLLVRRLYGKPEINPIVVMVGFLLVLESVAAAIWSTNQRSIPSPFAFYDWQVGGNTIALSPQSVFQMVVVLGTAIGIAILFRFTKLGLQLRASAVAPEVARLLGVRVGRMLTLGWVLSTAVGAIAAIVLASTFSGLTPGIMDSIFIYGFIAAAIGGLESPTGAVLASVVLGVTGAYVSDYWNSNLILIVDLAIFVAILMIRPQGLFSKKITRRV